MKDGVIAVVAGKEIKQEEIVRILFFGTHLAL